MLNIDIKKCDTGTSLSTVASRKVILGNLEGIIQIDFGYKNMVELLQNTIIDLLVSYFRDETNVYNNFSLLLEKINKDIHHIRKDYDLTHLKVFLGIIEKEVIHFSILGEYHVYLIKNEKIIDIADGMQGRDGDFGYISSGAIGADDNIYVSNIDLLNYVTKDDIFEISSIKEREKKSDIINDLLMQELKDTSCHVIAITSKGETKIVPQNHTQQYIINISNYSKSLLSTIKENTYYKKSLDYITTKINFKNKYVKASSLGVGLVTCVVLLYMIIGGLINTQMSQTVPEEYKTKLINVKILLEKASKDIGNKDAFDKNIQQAETILFQLRDDNQEYLLEDRKKLLDYISVLKKQFNGIESFEVNQANAEITFQKPDFGLGQIFEISKKLYLIGKNSLIAEYIKGSEIKTYAYPDGEELLKSEATSDGFIYILTKSYRVLQFYKGEFSYVNVEGQETWETAKNIKSFNGNLYLLSLDGTQIYKHKPGVNGFSIKSGVLTETDMKNSSILDFAIDGGFYLLKNDLSLDKIFSTPEYSRRSIVLNKLPENYKLNDNVAPMFITGQNLNYLYVLLNGTIFIFQPDSRNYKDVRSAQYIGQLEPTNTKIQSVFIPSDGTIYIGDANGVYTIHYEISDGKIVVI